MAKNYTSTYIYNQYPKYEKQLFEFIIKSERIDTKSSEFNDVLYNIKRRKISDNLAKIVTSDNVVLCLNEGNTLPKPFKVFTAKDLKEDKNKIKVFIDVTGVIKNTNGTYDCPNIDWLISYIISAMVNYIYTVAPNKIIGNSSIIKDGSDAFTTLFTYIIDRMYKISSTIDLKKRVQYLSSLYYQINILGKDFTDSVKSNAIALTDIDKRNAATVDVLYKKEDFTDINTFVNSLGMLGFKDLKTANVISYWMNAFGTGTVLGLEYFPAFSAMMTDTYIGGYLNNQITIEKLTGPAMIKFTKAILNIGASVS